MTVDEDKINQLYAEPSVADYIPEEVLIVTDTNETISATCYNLPANSLKGANESYANSLYNLAKKIGFPSEYLELITDYMIKRKQGEQQAHIGLTLKQ